MISDLEAEETAPPVLEFIIMLKIEPNSLRPLKSLCDDGESNQK